ncbi:MAG: hypothetical protein ACFB8W_00365 [Elainellaceae cyanobacterium]
MMQHPIRYAGLLLLGSAIACTSQSFVSKPASEDPPPEMPAAPPPTSPSTLISIMSPVIHPPANSPHISQVSLIAREEPLPPLGVETPTDYPVGYADIFLTIENPRNQEAQIVLQQVTLLSDRGQVLPFTEENHNLPRAIPLGPMENAIIDLHRSSLTGYSQTATVRAIVTYEVDGVTYRIESSGAAIR